MKHLIFSFLVFLSFQSFAQSDAIINDASAEKRTLNGSFSGIYVTDGIELFLTQSDVESIAVSASDPKYMERYKTEVVDGILKIYYDNKGVNWTGNEKRKLKAYVSCKELNKLSASGGANVKMKSVLKADKLECTFTSGSNFEGEVAAGSLDIDENSGAKMDVTGKANDLKVSVSSGALFNAYELTSDYCNAKASSGGNVKVSINKELSVKASSGGGIRYKGEGVIKNMDVSSGGNVKKG